jgi:hypothetical protein
LQFGDFDPAQADNYLKQQIDDFGF